MNGFSLRLTTGLIFGQLVTSALCLSALAQVSGARAASGSSPVVIGDGVGLFKIGLLLHEDHFANLTNWVIQVQERSGFAPAEVEARDHSLDCVVPGRGCTVWFKLKLHTRVTITYDVLCPTPKPAIKGLQPRDLNNFWMATDPVDPVNGLFDPSRYAGPFSAYDKLQGYYASTGGGGAEAANLTTRMRRYPREVDSKPAEHLALTDKDGKPDFLITPDQVMTVQLVAYDDVIQYIVDGKLIYQIARGDRIQVEGRDSGDKPAMRETVYDLDRFPVYREGYFGFRMVGTHHIYTDFRVYALEPDDGAQAGFREIDSIADLRAAAAGSNQKIRMRPGVYRVTDALADNRTVFNFSGSNNVFDLRGVTIQIDTQVMAHMQSKGAHELGVYRVSGDRQTFLGATFEDVGDAPPQRGLDEFSVTGDDAAFKDCRFVIRGSAPYGCGDLYGKGAGAAVRLQKHGAIAVLGDRCRIEDCYFRIHTFGHGIHMHGAQNTLIRNVTMLGDLRPTDEIYRETTGPAAQFGYKVMYPPWRKGQPIPHGEMLSLTEDGIRAYTSGADKHGQQRHTGPITADHCFVERMRGGIVIEMATGGRITGCTAIDCGGSAYSVPPGGIVRDSRGNAAFSPLLVMSYSSQRNADIELELMGSAREMGNHPLAAVVGGGHSIKITSDGNAVSGNLRPIIAGSTGDRYAEAGEEAQAKQNRAVAIRLTNLTPHPIELTADASDSQVLSVGPVVDRGKGNRIERVNQSQFMRKAPAVGAETGSVKPDGKARE